MKILIHACCAGCVHTFVDGFGDEAYDLLWYNPNIHPYTEYKARKNALVDYAKARGINVFMYDEYGLRDFVRMEALAPEKRCGNCYETRLRFAAKTAKEQGCDAFSTSLLASPYQDFDTICRIGNALAAEFGLEFVMHDSRQNYRKCLQEVREMGLYTQKYCGCIFSEEERYLR